MAEFFRSLKPIEQVFLICAVLGGTVFVIRLLLFFLGLGGDHDGDMGHAGDAGHAGDVGHGHSGGAEGAHHDGDTESSFKFFSLQSLTAFFMMFGLVGLALSRQNKWPESLSTLGGFAGGLLSVWVIGKIFDSMRRLQSDGTLDIRNAVGEEGIVYLTIPASGKGIVQITVQGSLRELSAVSLDKTEIKTGNRVVVEDIIAGSTLVVKES